MRYGSFALLLMSGLSQAYAQEWRPRCTEPTLADSQIKTIIDRERVARVDLPRAYEKYRWVVRRQGCYYIYVEIALPEVPDRAQTITLNQKGVIVDVDDGRLKPP